MSAQTLPKRAEVPVELTWDLSTMYANVAAWEQDFREVERLTPTLAQYKGKLSASADNLVKLLQLRDQIGQVIDKLFCYAHQRADEDTAVSANVALRERARLLFSNLGSAI